jgi:hypothetical protein
VGVRHTQAVHHADGGGGNSEGDVGCDGVAFGTASDLKKHISAIHLKIKRSRGAKYA